MSAGTVALDRAAGLAPAARLLSAWWSRPTAEERERWNAGQLAALEVADALELDPAAVDALQEAIEGAQPELLLEEYERLLVGPGRAPCQPYESMWRADLPRREQGRLMAACAADVARLYAALGLRVRTDAHELPDQLVVECEALAYALERGHAGVATALLQEHLALWVPRFSAAVVDETEQPFYAALARLTPEWVAALAG